MPKRPGLAALPLMPIVPRVILFLSVAGLFLIGASGVRCGQDDSWGTSRFKSKVSSLERSNQCEKAISLLVAADAREDANWYAWLVDLRLDCLAQTGRREYGEEALRLVSEGTRRFPRSSRLLFLKGFVNGRIGEWGLELRYYEDALKLARENIAADIDGRHSEEDRAVAANAEANLRAARKPTPVSGALWDSREWIELGGGARTSVSGSRRGGRQHQA